MGDVHRKLPDVTHKIYVTDSGKGLVTTYLPDGSPTSPTITVGGARGIAVDHNGKIYVTNGTSVSTYNPDGSPTTPTITESLCEAGGVAVDSRGRIWVTNTCGLLNVYRADGVLLKVIGYREIYSQGIAIDDSDKVYASYLDFSDDSFLFTYKPNGKQTQPSIDSGMDFPVGVAVDAAGNIYVASTGINHVSKYLPNGMETGPTFTTGISGPEGIAIGRNGKTLYVANGTGGNVTTYDLATGKQTRLTISGLQSPFGVAYH